MKVIEVSLGNIVKHESGMPILEIVCKADERENIVYLSPFRLYKFQVSRNLQGEADLGSSAVIGLKNITSITRSYGIGCQSNYYTDGIIVELLKGQALMALHKYSHSNYIRRIFDRTEKETEFHIIEDFVTESRSEDKNQFHEFCKQVVEYMKTVHE